MSVPAIDHGDVVIYQGGALEQLANLDAGSAQCIVTSPPFWGLRDYGGGELEIGREATPEAWAARLVAVMREARRVLAPDGVAWVEVGDTYADRPSTTNGRKAKDLVGAPWLLAFALRADGWYLRSDTIWHRPNPMPESVTDRPTKAHSYVFLLSASDRYYYDADAIREAHQPASIARATRARDTAYAAPGQTPQRRGRDDELPPAGANARSVWTITPEGTPFEHYATMPTVLASRCIRTGSRAGDLVLDPFMGAGTTALVARALGRRAAGVELSPAYLDIARDRLAQLGLLT